LGQLFQSDWLGFTFFSGKLLEVVKATLGTDAENGKKVAKMRSSWGRNNESHQIWSPDLCKAGVRMKRIASVAIFSLSACVSTPTEVAQRQAVAPATVSTTQSMQQFAALPAARVQRSNADVARDFLELSFQMESGRSLPGFSRFESPIRVVATGSVPASARHDLAGLIARLRSEAGIDIAQTGSIGEANVIIEFLPRATLQSAVPSAACFVVPRVAGWSEFRANRGSSRLDWTTQTVRERATMFIPSDIAPQEVRDCLHEELSQAIGPLNDLYHLSDSIWNDDNFHGVLTGFDMLVLRATYAPELQSGMSRAEVAARLPGVLARINPAGQSVAQRPVSSTPRAWVTAIEQAVSPRATDAQRREGARRALEIAQAQGWRDNRRAFSHFVLARLSLANQVETAVINFAEASGIYRSLPTGALHAAHVDMQMAAFALTAGQNDEVLKLTARAMPAVQAAQNAGLLATLQILRAEALAGMGRMGEAQAVRLDSLPWARYGFGSEAVVQRRMAEIAALAPRRTAGRF